jgi:CHAT domain-containing protein
VSSYTPTLTSLIQAQKGQSTFDRQWLQVMIVATKITHSGDMPRLQYVVPETRDVLDVAAKAGLNKIITGDTASKTEIPDTLQSSLIVHLACHGIQDNKEPHRSRFCLSTCETAKGDKENVDEAIHLAATMLFAGFKSVVATMW